jgi:hypothetical protein
MHIVVVNSKKEQAGAYIGRPSVLGNPYRLGPGHTRQHVVDAYRLWLRAQWRAGGAVKEEILRLARLAKAQQGLTLRCWCTPLAYHGDVVAEAISSIVERGLV